MASATPAEPRILHAHPLAPLTSWRIGGPAAYFSEPKNPEELRACLEFAEARGLPVFALGGGSNLLISDEGYPGLVVRYADLRTELRAGGRTAGTSERGTAGEAELFLGARHALARAARRSASDGWAGLEWAEGIPGTIGGAVVGNAGAYGGEIAQLLERVRVFSLARGLEELSTAECGFDYRRSAFQPAEGPVLVTSRFVVDAVFRLRGEDPARLTERMREIGNQRRSRTPAGLSCGSVFRNPPGDSAGRLIEQIGLKGAEEGGAQISPLHANYIVNRGGATARDVRALIDRARAKVRQECGIELVLEVRLLG